MASVFLIAAPAEAGFIGSYSLSNWSFSNTYGDGSVMTPDGGLSVILSGPNNGSGLSGNTKLMIAAVDAGLVEFDWSYDTLDDPGFELGGYILADRFVQLSSTDGEIGSASFTIGRGEEFGFAVFTTDNTGGPGILTISNFNVDSAVDPAGEAVPEPESLVLVMTGVTALAASKYLTGKGRPIP